MQLDLLENTTTSSCPLQGSLTSVETGQTPTRKCSYCKEVKPITEFHRNKTERIYQRNYRCKPCTNATQKTKQHKLYKYGKSMLSKYGLTWEMHTDLMFSSLGHCNSCNEPFVGGDSSIHIDHCHEHHDVRGVLCRGCNLALGLLKENPKTIRALSRYQQRTRVHPFLKSEDLHLSKTHKQG